LFFISSVVYDTFYGIVAAKQFAVPGFPEVSLSGDGNYGIRFLWAGNPGPVAPENGKTFTHPRSLFGCTVMFQKRRIAITTGIGILTGLYCAGSPWQRNNYSRVSFSWRARSFPEFMRFERNKN